MNLGQAFNSIKSIYKYHLRRREGNIIKSIKTVKLAILDKVEIDTILTRELSKIQVLDNTPLYEYKFPRLQNYQR